MRILPQRRTRHTGGYKVTKATEELKLAVLVELSHVPLTNKILAKRLGFNDPRPVRQAVHDLIVDDNQAIISTPKGIKFADSAEEIDENITTIDSYIEKFGARKKHLKIARRNFTEQLKMKLVV